MVFNKMKDRWKIFFLIFNSSSGILYGRANIRHFNVVRRINAMTRDVRHYPVVAELLQAKNAEFKGFTEKMTKDWPLSCARRSPNYAGLSQYKLTFHVSKINLI